jgi:hypothetical protein
MNKDLRNLLILLFIILFVSVVKCNGQGYHANNYYTNNYNKNSLTAYYGIANSVTLEYGRYFTKDVKQLIGFDIGVGYIDYEDVNMKTTVGIRALVLTRSKWNVMYKMGIVLYDIEYYDVFIGVGVEKGKMHLISKLNMIQLIGFNNEWIEIGVGFTF